jgi:hypothetical protein
MELSRSKVDRPGLYIYRGHVDLLGLLLKISLS